MRAYLIVLLSAIHLTAAVAQQKYEYRYWFDTDNGEAVEGTSDNGVFSVEADMSSLQTGLHSFYFLIEDTESGASSIQSAYVYKTASFSANRSLISVGNNVSSDFQTSWDEESQLHLDIDASSLGIGLHTPTVQLIDDSGFALAPQAAFFSKSSTFNENKSLVSVDNNIYEDFQISWDEESQIHFDIDADTLGLGLHSLVVQLIDDTGSALAPRAAFFCKAASFGRNKSVISVDNDIYPDFLLSEDEEGSQIHIDIDANSLDLGFHTLGVQLIDDSGVALSAWESFFLKVPTTADLEDMSIYYVVDGNTQSKGDCTYTNGVFYADLDMSSLSDGLHSISFVLANSKGLALQANSAYFIKEPLGGNGIKSYQYWVNDDRDNLVSVDFDTPQEALSIIELLDMPQYPLRSSSFSFAVEDSVPVIYPKNTFYIMFEDAAGRYLSLHSDYMDVTMRQELGEDVFTQLHSGDEVKIESLGDNEISWYKFGGKEGDSISVRTDKSCTIDIFGPDGELVQETEGSSSIVSEGLYLPCDGEYYVAVHDAQSSSKDVTVYFYNDNTDVETAVSKVYINAANDQNVYDLSGRKIEGNLRPGVYIMNGKKVLVR
ncbi:MAG: hypothetical protein LUC91_06550 [Prevotella sp.]|nr:hypothetical protein [Prevotella sp.]